MEGVRNVGEKLEGDGCVLLVAMAHFLRVQ